MSGPDPGATNHVRDLVDQFVDGYLAEDDVLLAARQRAVALGTTPIGAAGGAALCFLAATIAARAVVEVGTGTGVSGLWLLRGMAADGVLTSIDVDPENQRAARSAFLAAGYALPPPADQRDGRWRCCPASPTPRYDLVFVDALPVEYPRYLDRRCGCCAPGGLVVLDDALRGGRVADATASTPRRSRCARSRGRSRDDERLAPVLLPVGDGLLCACAKYGAAEGVGRAKLRTRRALARARPHRRG